MCWAWRSCCRRVPAARSSGIFHVLVLKLFNTLSSTTPFHPRISQLLRLRGLPPRVQAARCERLLWRRCASAAAP